MVVKRNEPEEFKEMKRIYTNEELRDFKITHDKFIFEKKITFPKEDTIQVFDDWKFLNSVGACRGQTIINLRLYHEADNKLEQYSTYRSKVAYAKKKELEGYSELIEKYEV